MTQPIEKPGSPEAIKTSIQKTALLLIDGDPHLYRPFMRSLNREMSVMERGDMPLDVSMAVQELIDQGQLVLVNYQTPQSTGTLIVPAGFKIV